MKNNLKLAAVAVVLFLALGVVAFVYAGTQNNVALADTQGVNTTEMQTLTYLDNQTDSGNQTVPSDFYGPCPDGNGRGMMGGDLGFGQHFLSENTTLATIEGTVVTQTRNILILSTDSNQVRLIIPDDWTVGNIVTSGADLFNGTFASSGQTVTLSVLKSEIFSNASFSVNSMLAYEATNASAQLPTRCCLSTYSRRANSPSFSMKSLASLNLLRKDTVPHFSLFSAHSIV